VSVKAITPRVVAISGHMQFYRDADHYDRAQDELATGEDIFSPEWPDKPLNLKPTRGSGSMPALGQRRAASPMQESAGHAVSMDGRSALSPSSSLAPADCSGSNATGGSVPLLLPAEPPKPLARKIADLP
jgi:hypothetical protein